jgi:hypothetical protein
MPKSPDKRYTCCSQFDTRGPKVVWFEELAGKWGPAANELGEPAPAVVHDIESGTILA